jgi:hypothetical protein
MLTLNILAKNFIKQMPLLKSWETTLKNCENAFPPLEEQAARLRVEQTESAEAGRAVTNADSLASEGETSEPVYPQKLQSFVKTSPDFISRVERVLRGENRSRETMIQRLLCHESDNGIRERKQRAEASEELLTSLGEFPLDELYGDLCEGLAAQQLRETREHLHCCTGHRNSWFRFISKPYRASRQYLLEWMPDVPRADFWTHVDRLASHFAALSGLH